MLGHRDALPTGLGRVLLAGTTGSGKTTLGRRLGDLWGIAYTELDGLYHGPGWTPRASFLDDVRALVSEDTWITEWGYGDQGAVPVLGERAHLVVWLDLPRRTARTRLVRRTLLRRIRGEELWNGNVERPLHTFVTDPDANILRWEMRSHRRWRERMPEVERTYPHLCIVRLRSPAQVRAWLDGPAADRTR